MKQRYVVSYTGKHYINVDKIVSIEDSIRDSKRDLLIEDVNSNTFAVFSGSEDQVKFVLDKLIKWICDSDDSLFYIKNVHKQYVDEIAESERYKEQ